VTSFFLFTRTVFYSAAFQSNQASSGARKRDFAEDKDSNDDSGDLDGDDFEDDPEDFEDNDDEFFGMKSAAAPPSAAKAAASKGTPSSAGAGGPSGVASKEVSDVFPGKSYEKDEGLQSRWEGVELRQHASALLVDLQLSRSSLLPH
jgi:hypothetical protein